MELRQLRYFVAVARELSFSRAARTLNISQPPLSYQIKQLEEELGVRLFDRTKRAIRLTPTGTLFLPEVEQILAAARKATDAARRARTGEVGSLTISCMSSADVLVVPRVVAEFQRHYPDVHLTLMNLNEIEQVEAIEEGRVQVAFATLPISMRGDGVTEHLYSEPLVAALPAGHRLARSKEISLASLADEAWIVPDRRATPSAHFTVSSICAGAGFSPRVVHYCDHVQFMLSLIAAGLGVTVLPKRVELLPRLGVVFVPLDAPFVKMDLGVCYRSSQVSGVLATFLNVARKAFSEASPL